MQGPDCRIVSVNDRPRRESALALVGWYLMVSFSSLADPRTFTTAVRLSLDFYKLSSRLTRLLRSLTTGSNTKFLTTPRATSRLYFDSQDTRFVALPNSALSRDRLRIERAFSARDRELARLNRPPIHARASDERHSKANARRARGFRTALGRSSKSEVVTQMKKQPAQVAMNACAQVCPLAWHRVRRTRHPSAESKSLA